MVEQTQGSPLTALARAAVEEYIRFGRTMSPPTPIQPDLETRTGAFVSLKVRGHLRGCIGTIQPTQPNLAEEIIQNAIGAAVRDPRFEPVTSDDLDDLHYSVDVLSDPEAILDFTELDPKRYGVIVESGLKRGLLLPDLDGVDTVEEQVGIAMRKGGIYPGEPISLYRFEVKRHAE